MITVGVVNYSRGPLQDRNSGNFSSSTPQIAVQHYPQVVKHAIVDARILNTCCQAIIQEDYKCYVTYEHRAIPLCYLVTDSTLSDEHYQTRHEWAKQNKPDLILLDWDSYDRWEDLGIPLRRFSHSVNPARFKDWGQHKTIDVGFYCRVKGSPEREVFKVKLAELCRAQGWNYDGNIYEGDDYAFALNRTRIVVQINRTPTTRAHRTFDAMACWTCLLTEPLPQIDEDRTAGIHYLEWQSFDELPGLINTLLNNGKGGWWEYADQGKKLVEASHYWPTRAIQLANILTEAFPWLA